MISRVPDRPQAGPFTDWVLRAMDSDFTWQGLGRLRPAAKTERLGPKRLLALVLVTSSPFLLVAGGLCLALPVTPVIERTLAYITFGGTVTVALQCWAAAIWNQRASRLAFRRRADSAFGL